MQAEHSIKDLIDALQDSVFKLETENTEMKQMNEELRHKLDAIGKMFNGAHPPQTVQAVKAELRKNGAGKRSPGKRLTDDTREKIIAAYKARGKNEVPVRAIADQFEVSPFTVYEVLKKAKVKRRRG